MTEHTTDTNSDQREQRRGFDRSHLQPGRRHRLYVRLTDDERAALADAAQRAGMTPTGYCAEAALAAATGKAGAGPEVEWEELRETVAELFAARTAVGRYANNVNQAVTALHTDGQPPVWLADAIRLVNRTIQRVDAAADRLCRMLPDNRHRR